MSGRGLGEPSFHHLHVAFFTLFAVFTWLLVQSDLEAVGAYSGGVRDLLLSEVFVHETLFFCENQTATNSF